METITRDKIPIDETHVANVDAQLVHLRAAGPAPRKTWTRQALVDRMGAAVTAMRAEGFSLDEIADAMSHNGVTFTAEMLSSYLSRQRHGIPGNGVTTRAQRKKASKKPSPTLAPTTRSKTSPPRDTTRDPGDGRTDIVVLVAPDLPTTTAQVSLELQPAETKDQDTAPLKIGAAATTKSRNAWMNRTADPRALG